MSVFDTFRAEWEANVQRFGAATTWTQSGGYSLTFIAGYAIGRQTDVAIANALGVGARTVTIRAIDTAGRTPRPLDRLDVAGETLTINFVTPVVLAGKTCGWRCICAGVTEP